MLIFATRKIRWEFVVLSQDNLPDCRQPAVQRRGCDGGGVAAAPRPRPRPRPLRRAAAAPPALLRARHGRAGGAVGHGQPGTRRGVQVGRDTLTFICMDQVTYSLFLGFQTLKLLDINVSTI